jgi:hypothetical protein
MAVWPFRVTGRTLNCSPGSGSRHTRQWWSCLGRCFRASDVLDLRQLGQVIAERHTTDLLRLETLPFYDTASDGGDYQCYLAGEARAGSAAKQPWLDRLRTDTAAGRRWRRAHVVELPLSDYLRYECEWGYTDNVVHGEDVHILVVGKSGMSAVAAVGDFFVIDHRHVIRSQYDAQGRFVGAEPVPETADAAAARRALAEVIWEVATPFTAWWQAHPEFHRGCA